MFMTHIVEISQNWANKKAFVFNNIFKDFWSAVLLVSSHFWQ